MDTAIDTANAPVRMVVLDCGAMFDPMRRVLRRSGLLQKLGPENIFSTVGESIRAYVGRAKADLGRYVDSQRVDEPPRPSGGKREA